MANRWDRPAPLLGVAFVVLLAVDFVVGGTDPQAGASAAKVVSWYSAHRSSVRVSDCLMVVAPTPASWPTSDTGSHEATSTFMPAPARIRGSSRAACRTG
jgi:hypothetical protein